MEKEHEIILKAAQHAIQAVYEGTAWEQAMAMSAASAPTAVQASDIAAFVEVITR